MRRAPLSVTRKLKQQLRRERGSGVVEFLGVTLVFVMPLVYFVIALGQVQNAAFAMSVIAQDAARITATQRGGERAERLVATTTRVALNNYGIRQTPAEVVRVNCAQTCATRGAQVTATAHTTVTLPLVPDFLTDRLPVTIPVSATRVDFVGEYSD